jgi:membrane protease YdiL (CAAX protease family)
LRRLANPPVESPPWSLLTAIIALIAALAALIIGTVIMLSLLGPTGYAPLLGWILGCGAAAAYIWSAFRRDRAALRTGPTQSRLFVVLLFGLGMAVLIDLIDLGATGNFLPAPELLSLLGADAGIMGWLAAIFLMLVAQPVAEELAFRGVFYPSVRQALGGWGSLLVCAVLYGLFHLVAYSTAPGDNLWHTFITPALNGLVITGVRANTGSTRAAIIAHAGFGIFALLKLLAVS